VIARANLVRAGELLASTAGGRAAPDGSGYVALQTVPYRSHHLLLAAVLERTRPGDVVFEGGVSSGYFAQAMIDAGLVVDGAELDEAAAARARSVCRAVWTGDLDRLDVAELRGPYAALLFGDTLEHLADPVPVLRRLRSVLEPTGALVVSVPNVANWAMRLQLLAGRFRYTDRGLLDRTHLRFYTERTLLEMLAEAGFRPVDVRGAVPVPLVRSAALCRLFHRVGNLRRSLFAYSFVVTAVPA
jgi:2-polyprenyl-3-methyl-5-hydroxy-6-metoxy-1,4-benzoquinol methylase